MVEEKITRRGVVKLNGNSDSERNRKRGSDKIERTVAGLTTEIIAGNIMFRL